jgi:hypothetical protein
MQMKSASKNFLQMNVASSKATLRSPIQIQHHISQLSSNILQGSRHAKNGEKER